MERGLAVSEYKVVVNWRKLVSKLANLVVLELRWVIEVNAEMGVGWPIGWPTLDAVLTDKVDTGEVGVEEVWVLWRYLCQPSKQAKTIQKILLLL